MDWKFLLTTAISLLAVIIAWKARKDAKKSIDTTNSLQQRLEVYEYLPIIKLAIEPDGDRVKILITNASAKNAASDCILTTTIRIWSGGGVYSADKEQIQHNHDLIPPQKTICFYPEDINVIIANSLPFIKQYPSEKDNFVIRTHIECSAPHPRSPKSHEEVVSFFSYENGHLVYKKGGDRIV